MLQLEPGEYDVSTDPPTHDFDRHVVSVGILRTVHDTHPAGPDDLSQREVPEKLSDELVVSVFPTPGDQIV